MLKSTAIWNVVSVDRVDECRQCQPSEKAQSVIVDKLWVSIQLMLKPRQWRYSSVLKRINDSFIQSRQVSVAWILNICNIVVIWLHTYLQLIYRWRMDSGTTIQLDVRLNFRKEQMFKTFLCNSWKNSNQQIKTKKL